MQLKNIPEWSWMAVGVGAGGAVLLVVWMWSSVDKQELALKGYAQRPSGLVAQVAPLVVQNAIPLDQMDAGIPLRLKIPTIGVDALVEQVGLTRAGLADAPRGRANAGWFSVGTRPGNIGSAVIDGHFGWKDGLPAVFDKLHSLKVGDRVYVEDDKGATTSFVVRELKKYEPTAEAEDVFGVMDGGVHLNLITCIGVWNKKQQSYAQRLVVFADKE